MKLSRYLLAIEYLAAFFLLAAATHPRITSACMGTPPPLCGRTLVLTTEGPDVLLAPAGGPINFNLAALGFFNVFEAPPGACSPLIGNSSATLDVDISANCTGPDDGSGVSIGNMIMAGFTDLTIPVSLDAGVPRICTLDSTATATLDDGSTLTATSSNTLCVGEPSAADPNLPRLDIRVADGGSNLQRVHPGDQASLTYRITNNDPNERFTGVLEMRLINQSRMPDQTPPGTVADGPFSISNPVEGDNFPIGFAEDLVNGCLYIPEDPSDPAASTIRKLIDLAPGESTDVDVFARPFGGCSDGSCGTATLILEGTFSDQSEGLACTGFVVAADTSVAPQFAWPQSGSVINVSTLGDFAFQFIASPQLLQTVPLNLIKSFPSIEFNGSPTTLTPIPSSFDFDGERGRIFVDVGTPGTTILPGGSTFSYSNEFQVSPGAPLLFDFTTFRPASPAGFESIAPGAEVTIGFRSFGQTDSEWFLDLLYQTSGHATYDNGEQMPLIIGSLTVGPGSFPDSFSVFVNGQIPVLPGSDVDVFTVTHDLRGFARPNADFDQDGIMDDVDNCILRVNPDQRDTNGDGFGNLCDADFNNDDIVNTIDLGILRAAFFSRSGDPNFNEDADFNGDNVINPVDLGIMRSLFFRPPGPSSPNS